MGIVLASTGFTADDLAMVEAYSKEIAIFKTANLSLGVNLMQALIKAAAERASLRELLEDERAYCQLENVAIAALKNEDEEKPDNDKE